MLSFFSLANRLLSFFFLANLPINFFPTQVAVEFFFTAGRAVKIFPPLLPEHPQIINGLSLISIV